MPILTFESLDAVPEGLREHAKDQDGRISINVVPAAKLDEFRDTNINLVKERDALKAQVDVLAPIVGEDPNGFQAKIAELEATAQRVKDGSLKEGRQIEEEVIRRTDDMRKGLEEQIRAAQKETGHWRAKATETDGLFKQTLVVSAIKDAAMASDSGVIPEAIGDITKRALGVWRCTDDGKVVAYQGDLQLYGADGASPLTPKEWIGKLKEEAPFYFKGTQGGGAGGDGKERNSIGRTTQEMRSMSASEKLAAANGDKGSKL